MNVVRGTKRNAVLYSNTNDFQLQFGKELAITAGINDAENVLDLGCGTGEVTALLAQMVGREARVVGVDPDLERIKVAAEKHSGIHDNIVFIHGDSSSRFLQFNQRHYDVHFSNFVIQWLNHDEKKKFIDTAFQVLKPGGKIAIQSHEGDNSAVMKAVNQFVGNINNTIAKVQPYFSSKAAMETSLRNAGFCVLYSEYFHCPYTFATAEDFLAFVNASDYYDDTKTSQKEKDEFFKQIVNKDGTVTVYDPTIYQVIAIKNDLNSE
jgi:ubiquinone/menaquinone biosynthesis C-methylase UbiE